MLLADLGAEVTKVERPGGGDETRSWGPPYDDRGEATYFQSVNRNKTSRVVDMGTEAGLEELRALAREADVLVENFRPGLMASKGLGHESLRAANPRLIYCSITGFGSGAGGAALPGYDLLIQALGGLMSVTGEPEGEPKKVGVALVDVLAGLFAAVGILAALRHRDATGEGQLVEVDLLSSLLAALVNQGSAFTHRRRRPRADGQPPPEHRALRALPDRRRGAGPRGRQRPSVRGALRDARRARPRRRPPLRHQRRPGREPRGALATSSSACSSRARRPTGRPS